MVAKKVDVLFVLLTFFLLPLFGCRNEKEDNYIRNTLLEFEEKAILFPDKMLCVENGISRYREISITEPTFIIYIGPEECNECALAHLSEKAPLFKLSNQTNDFQVRVIISPIEMNVQTLFKQILDYKYPFPVYIDTEGYMKEKNTIPNDSRFHYFLIDRLGYPIMVGNPLKSSEVETLFWSALQRIRET